MAQQTNLEGLRDQIITQLFGRRIGFARGNDVASDPEYLAGFAGVRQPITGFSSGGTTVTSTDVASDISPSGITAVGATGASATTAYTLAAPVPGVLKTLFNPTTGAVTVLTTGAGAFICSTASITSTHGSMTFAGKGNFCLLVGLSTALWGVVSDGGLASVQLTSAASTALSFTRNVTFV